MPRKPAKLKPQYNGKHPGGRPPKYHPDLCKDLVKFFDRPFYIKKIERKNVDGEWVEVEHEVPNRTPFLIDWVMKHDLHTETPSEWAKKYPEFSVAYNRAKTLQERFLVELGIKGDHNGFMTFQTLKNVSGWRDKQEVEHTGDLILEYGHRQQRKN